MVYFVLIAYLATKLQKRPDNVTAEKTKEGNQRESNPGCIKKFARLLFVLQQMD